MEMVGCESGSLLVENDETSSFLWGVTCSSNSFTSMLELPGNNALELLRSTIGAAPSAAHLPFYGNLSSLSSHGFFEVAAKHSVYSFTGFSSPPIKREPIDGGSLAEPQAGHGTSDPATNSVTQPSGKQTKRKERKNTNGGVASKKRSKTSGAKDGERLPYVYVRARRGQATDNHSLAERARREKINGKMKLLQELVPGCSKITGTALVLDEIISHVQSLQRQVELLSLRLATENPKIDFNVENLFAHYESSGVQGTICSHAFIAENDQ